MDDCPLHDPQLVTRLARLVTIRQFIGRLLLLPPPLVGLNPGARVVSALSLGGTGGKKVTYSSAVGLVIVRVSSV